MDAIRQKLVEVVGQPNADPDALWFLNAYLSAPDIVRFRDPPCLTRSCAQMDSAGKLEGLYTGGSEAPLTLGSRAGDVQAWLVSVTLLS